MPRQSKRAARLLREARDDKARYTLFRAAVDELRQMEKEGVVPEGSAEKYHPVRTLIRISEDPNMLPSFRLLAAKEILGYIEAPKSAAMRLEAAVSGDTQITVVIAPWASAQPPKPALPPPPEPESKDAEEAAHAGMRREPAPAAAATVTPPMKS